MWHDEGSIKQGYLFHQCSDIMVRKQALITKFYVAWTNSFHNSIDLRRHLVLCFQTKIRTSDNDEALDVVLGEVLGAGRIVLLRQRPLSAQQCAALVNQGRHEKPRPK